MEDQIAHIAEIEQNIADLKVKLADKELSREDRLVIAGEIVAAKETLIAEQASLATLEAALAEDEVEEEVVAEEETVEVVAEDEVEAVDVADEEAPASDEPAAEVIPITESVADAGDIVEENEEVVALAASASDTDGGEQVPFAAPYTLTASATFGAVNAGTVLNVESVRSVLTASMRGGEGRQRMFTVNRFPEGTPVVSGSNSAIENSRIMAKAAKDAQRPQALTAAACFCGPDEILPNFDAIGSRLRPVAAVFNSVPINGGFEYFKDIAINPDSGSVQPWTCADQDDVDSEDPDTWKQCSELDCFTSTTAYPYMITACTIVSVMHNWAHPEQVRTWLDKIAIEYARKAEQYLLNIIDANGGTALTVGATTGAGLADYGLKAQMIYALGNLAFPLAYQFRAEGLQGHVAIVERGFVDAMLADEKLRGFAPENYTREDVIADVFTAFGVSVVERLDEPTGVAPLMGAGTSTNLATPAQATVTALNAGGEIDEAGSEPGRTPLQPLRYRTYLLRPDQFIHAEGVLVGADWHQDVNLLRQNKLLYFMENMELLEWSGLEKVYNIDVYGFINGARADLVWPFGANVPDPT